MKYYNIKPIAAKRCEYNIIYGGRASGKSYQMAEYLLDDYIDNGAQFVRIIRSWGQGKGLDTYFQEVIDNNPKKYKDVKVELTQDKGFRYTCNGEIFGYIIPLSLEHNYKSNQYPSVVNVVFEEFVAPSPMDYLNGSGEDELRAFKSALSTIFRHRSGRVWLIGNSMNTSNPYFEFFGIDGSQLKVGDLKKFTRMITVKGKSVPAASVAVEYVPIGYTDPNEVPVMMRLPDNEIAITGAIEESENVTDRIQGVYNESGYFIGWMIDGEASYEATFCWKSDARTYYITQFYCTGDVFIIESGEQRNSIHLDFSDSTPDMFPIQEARKIKDPNIPAETGVEVGDIYFASSATEYHYMSDVTAYNKRMRLIQAAGMTGGYDSTTQNGRRQINEFANNHTDYIGEEMFVIAEHRERNSRKSKRKW